MLRRHSALEIDIGEQRPRRCIRSAHADPPRCGARMESYSLADVSRREVQQPAKAGAKEGTWPTLSMTTKSRILTSRSPKTNADWVHLGTYCLSLRHQYRQSRRSDEPSRR